MFSVCNKQPCCYNTLPAHSTSALFKLPPHIVTAKTGKSVPIAAHMIGYTAPIHVWCLHAR